MSTDTIPEGGPSAAIRRFTICVVLGLLVALAFHSLMSWTGMHWPWTSFLFMEQDRFNDWHNSVAQARSGDPYFFYGTPALAAYFPAAYLIFDAATGLNRDASTALYLCVGECLLLAAVMAMYFSVATLQDPPKRERGLEIPLLLFLAFLCSYPVLFALDRGNIDVWIAAGCTLFVATYGRRFAIGGLLCLALAISVKGYPAAFLALLIVRRDYRGVALVAGATAVLCIAALLRLHGGVAHNLSGLAANLHLFVERYVLGDGSLFASSDPYNALRLLAAELSPTVPLATTSARVLVVYGPLCAMFAIVSAAFVLFVPAPAWRRLTAVCLIAILFPNVASDYKLCCLIPALMLLLLSPAESRREVLSRRLFLLLMIPKSYFFWHGHSISMFINPALLVGLGWQVMADRVAWRRARRLLPYRLAWYLAPFGRNIFAGAAPAASSGSFLRHPRRSLCFD